MNQEISFLCNRASEAQLAEHLLRCDENFIPTLSSRVNIQHYAGKIFSQALRFEAWLDDLLVGLVAVYCNDSNKLLAHITSVSILNTHIKQGIASKLMNHCIDHAIASGMQKITLEVTQSNAPAIKLYKNCGFVANQINPPFISMVLSLQKGNHMSNKRDYNLEIKDTDEHKYAYNFDLDVMHPFMIRSFEPFFKKGSMLELGSFKGDFTKRFLPYFDEVTCVEASDSAIDVARQTLQGKVNFVNSLFETVQLPKRYDNIVLTHVLEHINDPVLVLKRINDEWLADDGRFFLVCPNANAPSRQIAVKMGLISHNTAVTPAEAAHGHRCTYTLDTLERDAVAAGLRVVHRSGIFFKALANFQWDRLLQTDIISKEYLEGCYQLGQQYPDLCSSIFLMCEKGETSPLPAK